MTPAWPPASTRTEFSQHAEDCREPGMVWQARIRPGLPRRGYCPDCGAVSVTDRTHPITGTPPANKKKGNTR